MSKLLKPSRLDTDPSSPTAAKEWKHWYRTFTNFLEESGESAPDKLRALVNCVSPSVFELIEHCITFTSAISKLESAYVKLPNEIFARHLLATRRQQPGESIDEFLRELHKLGRDCNFKAVTADKYREDLVRDAFINGIASPVIRQRLLENKTLDLECAYNQAYTLDLAQRNAESYARPNLLSHTAAIVPELNQQPRPNLVVDQVHQVCEGSTLEVKAGDPSVATTYFSKKKCYFCGNPYHARIKCPARDVICNACGKKGHFAKVCRSGHSKGGSTATGTTATLYNPTLLTISAAFPQNLSHAATKLKVNGHIVSALIDSCSSDSFISEAVVEKLGLDITPASRDISMASSTLNTCSPGFVRVDLLYNDQKYPSACLGVMKDLCCDIILGHDFQKQHKSVTFQYGGAKPELQITGTDSVCALSAANIVEPSLFPNLPQGCKPIAVKSRNYSKDDQLFIKEQIADLKSEGIIEASVSPWRAQVVVVKDQFNKHKKRLCIDYSQTINQYTQLDAYPLPRIEEIVHDLAKYTFFSTFDLKSAYHQVKIKEDEKLFTAFEADGELYQFCRIPFGVTNGVAAFQRAMNKLIEEENLKDTYPYLDNITVGGATQAEHDHNVKRFLEVVENRKLTLNEAKSVMSVPTINVLGYCVGNNTIKPDPERLRPLQELPPPANMKALRRTQGMFAYYAKWIPNFSDKIQPLVNTKSFPLSVSALTAFDLLKKELMDATLYSVDESLPFVVECDASDVAISAVLNQGGRPVAFMSRTLQGSELHYPAVEKEATAIIEAVRKWNHFLARQHFTLITDQRSVAFMLDSRRRSKIKNSKIQEWRLELASYSYTIQYRPGVQNVVPDTLTRTSCCSMTSKSNLAEVHDGLCHPGVSRLLHFVRSRNLPFSTEDVRRICSSCEVCGRLKPKFYRPEQGTLIKATQPMERLSVDFKGPLPSATRNNYMLTIVDEYSRFPFVFPCPNMHTKTVIKCLDAVFSLCGMPSFIHSDQGASFMSQELKTYLSQKGVATSRTTPYHPIGNGQVERYNGIIWKTICLSLESHGWGKHQWEVVLPEALHSIRSLLCTATNETPHERFFGFQRRSTHGNSLPSWLLSPGPVLLRRQPRSSKHEPLVDEVELVDVNPMYANIRYRDGRESTVSVRDLAPSPKSQVERVNVQDLPQGSDSQNILDEASLPESPDTESSHDHSSLHDQPFYDNSSHDVSPGKCLSPPTGVRKSTRVSKAPKRYGWD